MPTVAIPISKYPVVGGFTEIFIGSVLLVGAIQCMAHSGDVELASVATTHFRDEIAKQCGVASLYALLRLNGCDCTYSTVEEVVPVGSRGTSLLELKNGAAKLGAKTSILRGDLDQLIACPKPVLVQYSAEQLGTDIGHYVVVLEATPEFCRILDPSFETEIRAKTHRFAARWNGVILKCHARAYGPVLSAVTAALFGLACCLVYRTTEWGRMREACQ